MKSLLRSLFGKEQQIRHATASPAASPKDQEGLNGAKVALQGDIAIIALEDVFQLFDFAALSGKLEVQAPDNTGWFYFRNGVLTYGMLQINQRKIGEILLESNLVNEAQLHECLQLHQEGKSQQRLGQLLVEKGYLQPDTLDDSLLCQVRHAFFEALSWHQGTFAFYQNEVPAAEEVQLYARIDHLLLEGMVYLDNTEDSVA